MTPTWYNCKPSENGQHLVSKVFRFCRRDGSRVLIFDGGSAWIRLDKAKAKEIFTLADKSQFSKELEENYGRCCN